MNHSSMLILGLRVDEPVVAFTDLLVSVICFHFAFKIHNSPKIYATIFFFKLYFLALGIGLLLGGIIGHAFYYKFNVYSKLAGWIPCMVSIFFIGFGVIEHSRILLNSAIVKVFKGINFLSFLCFSFLLFNSIDFKYVVIHSFFGLVFFVFCIEGFLYLKTKNQESGFLMLGVVFAAIAGILFTNKISFSSWFDYQSLSHLMILLTVIFFNAGIKKIALPSV